MSKPALCHVSEPLSSSQGCESAIGSCGSYNIIGSTKLEMVMLLVSQYLVKGMGTCCKTGADTGNKAVQ